MDPFCLSTGLVGLIAFAMKLVAGALGLIDTTIAAYDEAADELKGLQQDLEQLRTQMINIHRTLKLLASNTKDRGFKRLLKDESGQAAVQELCNALEETFNTLTEMTDRTNPDNLRPALLPPNKKSLEFTQAVLRHSFAPSKITDLVRCLRETRYDVQMCLTRLETTFQHVRTLYDIMGNGLARIASRASIFSTSTNLTVRVELAAWLKRLEKTWGRSIPRRSNSLPLRDFLQYSKHVTVAGISHMTDDLLGKIFYHLCEPGPLSLRHLLFVSRHFHSATVNNAQLWATVSFDPLFVRHFHQWPEQGNIFIEQCLLRSRSLPLCLYIDDDDFIAYDSTPLRHPLETFWKPEWRGLQRCTSMVWINRDHTPTTIPKIVAMLPKSLPSLHYISLSYFGDPIDGSQFPKCPVLERVEISCHCQPSPPFWGTSFLHVTTLSFGNRTNWLGYDMITLSQFPELHDLTLSTERDIVSLFGDDLHPPITFKHLQILRVNGYIPSGVVTKLVAPALKELHIQANAEHFTSIYVLQNSFEPHCQHIHALLPQAVSAKEPEWATNLSKLVKKCTRINSLYTSGWMEEECQKLIGGRSDVVLHVQ